MSGKLSNKYMSGKLSNKYMSRSELSHDDQKTENIHQNVKTPCKNYKIFKNKMSWLFYKAWKWYDFEECQSMKCTLYRDIVLRGC